MSILLKSNMCVRNLNQDKIIKQKLKPKFVINKNESQKC